jgi:hypothetical protein
MAFGRLDMKGSESRLFPPGGFHDFSTAKRPSYDETSQVVDVGKLEASERSFT